jgi:hypothetical protein
MTGRKDRESKVEMTAVDNDKFTPMSSLDTFKDVEATVVHDKEKQLKVCQPCVDGAYSARSLHWLQRNFGFISMLGFTTTMLATWESVL